MESAVNIPAVIIANAMGLTVLFSVFIGNFWRFKTNSGENRALVVLFVTSFISCIDNILRFFVDGRPGVLCHLLVYATNTWLYLADIIVALCWILLVASHLKIKLHRIHKAIIGLFCSICLTLIIVNFFTPVIYSVENNVYHRAPMYRIYLLLHMSVLIDGVILYFYARQRSGKLKFFQVWAFTAPLFIGEIIQACFYGISAVAPFTTVSIACITACLQNEFLFKDGLTGLYNRFYLNTLEHELSKKTNRGYVAILLDINDFKSINDRFGHNIGDKALLELSDILTDVVRENGTVIRYAGDEFIIIMNSQNDIYTRQVIKRINTALSDFNKTSGNPYELSVAHGHCTLRFKENTMDEFLDKIDKLMYDNKREYYSLHPSLDRRTK